MHIEKGIFTEEHWCILGVVHKLCCLGRGASKRTITTKTLLNNKDDKEGGRGGSKIADFETT